MMVKYIVKQFGFWLIYDLYCWVGKRKENENGWWVQVFGIVGVGFGVDEEFGGGAIGHQHHLRPGANSMCELSEWVLCFKPP